MSIVSYDLAGGEEPFLSFTWDRRGGPELRREGTSAPEMKVIDTPDQMTSNAVALRLGTWLVREKRHGKSERKRDALDIQKAKDKLTYDTPDAQILERMLTESKKIQSHERLFLRRLGDL